MPASDAYDRASRLVPNWLAASVTEASRVEARLSKSLAKRRFRPSQEKVCSTAHHRLITSKPTALGLRDWVHRFTEPTSDLGRAAVIGGAVDKRAFKTPSLRGVALRPYLMHDASCTSLRSLIAAYDRAGGVHVDPRIKPIVLTIDEGCSHFLLSALNPIGSTQ